MCQNILIGTGCAHAEQCLLKLSTSHFHVLNNETPNKNMLKRILIAICNENKADLNETPGTTCMSSRQEQAIKSRVISLTILVLVHLGPI